MKFILAPALAGLLALAAPVHAADRLDLHYAPEENLERIDVRIIDGAQTSVDMAAYVLTDVAVMEALSRAAARGVHVRLFVDAGEDRERRGAVAAAHAALLAAPGVETKINPRHVYMHLKSYLVDGALLRMGAANFSASGLKRQDNDLMVTGEATLVARFRSHFDSMWRR